MHFSDFKNILLKLNDFNLPGNKSLLKLAPPNRVKQFIEGYTITNPKHAAVMLLFYADKNQNTRITLILRNTYNGVHSNQISFPGGKKDKSDSNLKHTAIRETVEELGIDETLINLVGPLSQVYIPPSNFNVQPFVGIYNGTPFFNPDSKEVSLVIKPLLKDLLNIKSIKSEVFVQNKKIIVPSYIIEGHVVWGATAMIINEFITLFNDIVNS
jgi:8-oxo-dGTP pyrophosphatase MutT (NUDIX family)|tara:strand:+ start:12118 stop:12756 length:639 start_codon:yes stop_codon:yes gene_type:complete